MATVTQYENAYAALIAAFGEAMKEVMKNDQSQKGVLLTSKAFGLASKFGWDWENDAVWGHWANKATDPEILANGLAFAIQRARL